MSSVLMTIMFMFITELPPTVTTPRPTTTARPPGKYLSLLFYNNICMLLCNFQPLLKGNNFEKQLYFMLSFGFQTTVPKRTKINQINILIIQSDESVHFAICSFVLLDIKYS